MTDESDKGFGPWSRVPQWDGSPQTWRKVKRDVSWWISSLELASTSKYNLAARFLLRQEGIARQRGEEFQPDDLKHRPAESVTDPETGEELEASPADYLAGINKLMAAWETMNGRTALDKRGELRQAFYVDLSRKAGERVSEFCTRYRSLVADLRAEGVVIADGELGWFLRQKLGLDPLRKQLLDTSLQGSESYATIESEILRLFRDLHENDPLHRRFENRQPLTIRRMFASQRGHPSGASSAASTSSKLSSMSSWSKGPSSRAGSQPKQAYVTEALDEDAEEEALDDGSADPGDSGPLEEALQAEAEVLACELEEAEQEGVDPEIIQDLEAGIESAAETLVTMREARQTLANVRKDRGYGKATSGGGGKGNGKKNAQIQARKQSGKHNCFDCGQPGHWSGDKECPTPGAGAGRRPGSTGKPAKQVRITENEHVAAVTETVGLPLQDLGLPSQDGGIDHDVLMVAYMPKGMTLEQALQQNVGRSTLVADSSKLAPDKELVGALDSACNRSCCGNVWLNQYLEALKSAPKHVQDLIKCENECENFRFGNNGVVPSVQRWRLPAMIGQTLICIWISMVPIGTLGCLIGRDFMEAVGAIIDFTKRTLTCSLFPSGILKLGQMMAGHFMLEMVPVNGEWGAQTRSKWRRVGQDGIVDIQMERKSWAHYKMHMFVKHRPEHEHQLTEQALEASLFTGQLSSSSSSHESVLCELAGASSGSMAQSVLGGGDFEHCHADQRKRPARCQHPRKMAPNGPSHSTTCRLAQPRHSVVGGSASRMALLALSLSFGQVLFGLGRSVASHGNWPDLASWTPGEGGWQDDSFSSWGMSQASRPRGIPPSLLGGYAHGSYDWPWQWISWAKGSSPSSSTTTSEGRSSGSESSGSEGDHNQVLDRTKRWIANSQDRLVETGHLAGHPCGRQDDGAESERSSRACGWQVDGKHAFRQGISCWPSPVRLEVLTASSQANGSPTNGARTQAFPDSSKVPILESTTRGSSNHSHWTNGGANDKPRNGPVGCPNGVRGEPGLPGCGGRDDGAPARAHGSSEQRGSRADPPRSDVKHGFAWAKKPKPGVSQMISQAWARHCRDREAVSKNRHEVLSVMMEQWHQELRDGMNETFVTQFDLSSGPFVTEVYTDTEPIAKEARRRGLRASKSFTLGTGWDFRDASVRARALHWIKTNKPYAVILAFPCNPWSSLLYLNANVNIEKLREEARVLVLFAIEVALVQLQAGRHFLMENPRSSAAWKLDEMLTFLQHPQVRSIVVDMCRFGLCNESGVLHMKPTKLVTSSQALISCLMGMRCTQDHEHAPVIGGAKVTTPAGHYTSDFSKLVVSGFMKQFDHEMSLLEAHETLAAEDEQVALPDVAAEPLSSDEEAVVAPEIDNMKIPSGIRAAVQRLHVNTGHRSGRRLARALVLCGAPKEAVLAAKHLTCSICSERRAPRARRPATLPSVKDVGAQLHVDILMVEDAFKQVYPVIHATDKVSRYQLASLIPDKSTESVVRFLTTHWIPLLGAPQTIIADQGREFISQQFETWCNSRSIYLHHIAVQCPWQNGVAERSGATLKAIVGALVRAHSLGGADDLMLGVAEAVAAYNSDINEEGVSPIQAVAGRQQPAQGDVLAGVGNRLAEHSLIENTPSLARQVALRETARVAMVRMHYSRSLRRAELARARTTTLQDVPQPGDLCYFWRASKYNPRRKDGGTKSRRKLELRRWFGPAMMIAVEGDTNAFLTFRGQLTKCGLEHVRKASSLEQVSFDAWEEAIKDVIQAADKEGDQPPLPQVHDGQLVPVPSDSEELLEDFETPPLSMQPQRALQDQASDDEELIPPLSTAEIIAAIQPGRGAGSSQATSIAPTPSTPWSRTPERQLSAPLASDPPVTAQPGTPVPDLITEIGRQNRLQGPIERARALDRPASPRPPGEKRSASQELEHLRSVGESVQSEVPSGAEPSSRREPFEALTLDWEQLCLLANCSQTHPLLRVQALAEQDRRAPLDCLECDHGSWDGRWSFLCEREWQLMRELGETLPTGAVHEALNAQAGGRKEHTWRQMSAEDKKGFSEAAIKGWMVYLDNNAVEVLDMKTSGEVRRQLAKEKALDKIMQPRFVLTDKNDPLRTVDNPLPRLYSARLVVPGFRDRSNLENKVRRDAPTGCRISQHLLFCLGASRPSWYLLSGDIKSAFMKGDFFSDETRVLFLCQTDEKNGPSIPLKPGQLARVRKAVFGLADAPREWWLKLSRVLGESGWQRLELDAAAWLLWSDEFDATMPNLKHLRGMIVAHVDDLLFIGDSTAVRSFDDVGKILGFGSREERDFVWCGKRIRRAEDGSIRLSMLEYHQNLKEVYLNKARKSDLTSELNAGETRQLKALLGSFQWLVAQLRFDMAFPVSSLQGEKPTVGTMIKANSLVRQFQQDCSFELVFQAVDLEDCGIMVVCDAALGNVTLTGSAEGTVTDKVYSQSCYFVLIADRDLMEGRQGKFNVLDARSHRIPRVCRSTYGAETLSTEEGFDIGILCRGFLASLRGYNPVGRSGEPAVNSVDLQVVVDAKDVFDKGNSDTSTFGAQKSMAFTVAWLRVQLRKGRTALKWTSTENMWVDGGTKLMDLSHLRRILKAGEWCVSYSPLFVKQVYKAARKQSVPVSSGKELPGEVISAGDPLMNHLLKICEQRGWHFIDNIGIHVAFNAKSFRTPEPRFSTNQFPCRTSFARFNMSSSQCEWRQLEKAVQYGRLANQHALIGCVAPILVTFFHSGSAEDMSSATIK